MCLPEWVFTWLGGYACESFHAFQSILWLCIFMHTYTDHNPLLYSQNPRNAMQLTPLPYGSTDIDECSSDNGGCEWECSNTRGSFVCSCDSRYHLAEDGKSCKGETEIYSRIPPETNLSVLFSEVFWFQRFTQGLSQVSVIQRVLIKGRVLQKYVLQLHVNVSS